MRRLTLASLLLLLSAACGGGSSSPSRAPETAASTRGPVSLDKNRYAVFPDVDSGADPSVSAELGGKGFTGEGWERIAYWNKFGHPEGFLSRIDDYSSAAWLWWSDPEADRQLRRAIADPSVKLPSGPVENRYWQEYAKRAREADGAARTADSVRK